MYDPQDIKEALRRTKGLVFLAAQAIGCSPQTVYSWIERDPEVRAVRDAERGKLVDYAEMKLFQAINQGEQWAITLFLRTVGKDRGYVERQEHTGKDGEAIAVTRLPAKAPSRTEWEAQNRNGHAAVHEVEDAD